MDNIKFAIMCTTIEVVALLACAVIFYIKGSSSWGIFILLTFATGFDRLLEKEVDNG